MKNKQDVFSPAVNNLEVDITSHLTPSRTVLVFLPEEITALHAARMNFLVVESALKNHYLLPPVNPTNGGTAQRSLLME